jgi:hypothetical protein
MSTLMGLRALFKVIFKFKDLHSINIYNSYIFQYFLLKFYNLMLNDMKSNPVEEKFTYSYCEKNYQIVFVKI